MKFMLDANIIIGLLGGGPDVLRDRVEQCGRGDIVISSIAFAEVALGSWNGKRPSLIVLDQLPRLFDVVPFDHLAARIYAQLPFRRRSFDMLIAAHARSLNVTLITNNESDFAGIPDLRVENWTR
ncbi:type II toxin-antitoxin system VapC family toxin [uncultured Sphingomonas sp.]|uniref:type II toxin-antitoxin system VapC family toxin n=1 Tax=uncultured Sphingomonas sp. TaxID=158754 RepID=UPI0025DF5473|nr:type II toxin-antitoxin system VapC family toxin [uncultured Sphingomonas sp.]